MKKLSFLIFSLVSLLIFCGCSSDERIKAIEDACKEANCNATHIAFLDSIDSQESKAKIKEEIAFIDNIIKETGDSLIVPLLCPNALVVKQQLQKVLELPDYAYLRYKLYVKGDGANYDMYALVPYREDLMGEIKIVDYMWESDIEFQHKQIAINSVRYDLENLLSYSPEERLKRKNEMIIYNEKQKNAPKSWQDVANVMKKKGCSVIGIYQGTQQYAGTLAIYSKGGTYYIAPCSISSEPVDYESADNLRKLNSNSYQHNEPGSDMPEKYVINGSQLISYCYNPDMGEWVNMGSYKKIY